MQLGLQLIDQFVRGLQHLVIQAKAAYGVRNEFHNTHCSLEICKPLNRFDMLSSASRDI